MAELALTVDDQGIYEQPLAAGATVEVQVHGDPFVDLTFAHHGGTAPLYVAREPGVPARDPRAMVVFIDGTLDRSYGPRDVMSFWLTCSADVTWSIARRVNDGQL